MTSGTHSEIHNDRLMTWFRKRAFLLVLILGVLIRIIIWYWIPHDWFASDEGGYYQAGKQLIQGGTQDIFWPPVTGWLIAIFGFICNSFYLKYIRFFWIVIDVISMILLYRISTQLVILLQKSRNKKQFSNIPTWVSLCYALYLPAISFSQFATSETLTVFFLLCLLFLLLSNQRCYAIRCAIAGGLAGIVILTRANMAGLMFTLPIAIVIIPVVTSRKMQIRCALILAFFTMVVVSCYVARNWHFYNQLTISTNSYYNLYIGNKKVYQEDLNLFNPFATKEQKEFRLRMKGISSPKTDLTLDEMRKLGIKNIIDKPLLFLRRALGRLARIFVPKTAQLQLVGGESSRSVFSLPSMILLIITNLQWGVFLVFGFAGLLCLKKLNLRSYALILAIILGSIPFCLVAVSKPRYSFPFDPLLIFCTCLFVLDFKNNWSHLWLKKRRQFLILMLFFAWAWIAWLIFAFSSRLAL